jgi:hypothetical protein
MKKVVIFSFILILLSACSTDVIRTHSEKSLEQIVTNFKDLVDEKSDKYILTIDNKNSLIIKKDYSSKEDFILELDATPFIEAGINNNNIPEGYKLEDNKLISSTDFGKGKGKNFLNSFFMSVDNKRDKLSYHEDLDHYGITLSDNNKFEFAKDYKTNDLDIVFVLSATSFKDLIDVKNINGWTLKTLKQKDETKIDVLLKPYNIKNK